MLRIGIVLEFMSGTITMREIRKSPEKAEFKAL